ncbi:MAG: hypothetical protein R3E79_00970 [Caldilineaceae bacterium]
MLVNVAKAIARQWVMTEGSQLPGFCGAFYHGSTNWLAADAPLPPTSDLDIMVVLTDPDLPPKLGKFIYQDVMLEVSYLAGDQLQSPEAVLRQSHLAGSFQADGIIADPTGQLRQLQAVVAREYAKRQWVYARCAHARDKILHNLRGLNPADPFHDQVAAWLFAAGVTTHVLLVAGLRNPTVRQRYVAVRELLAEYDHLAFYAPLLDLLGCGQMSRAAVETHLAALTAAFDAAKTVIKTPFFFAADIRDIARPVSIDGSHDLIARGYHREAVFWMVATYSRCQKVFYQDAPPAMQETFTTGYRRLLADLGITSCADLQQRGEQIKDFLPQVWTVAEAILNANPAIEP